MIEDILRQNRSTLHSLSMISSYDIPPKQSDAPKLVRGEGSWKLGMERLQFQSPTVTASPPRSRPCSRRVSEFFQTHS